MQHNPCRTKEKDIDSTLNVKPLRIAMVGWEFPPFITGGLGVHCYELTRALSLLGHEIDFFMPRTRGAGVLRVNRDGILEVKEEENEGVRLISVKLVGDPFSGAYGPLRKREILRRVHEKHRTNIDAGGAIEELYAGDFFGRVEYYNKKVAELLSRLHARRNYHLIHCHDWLTVRGAFMARERTGLPVVMTIHATEFDRAPVPWDKIYNIEVWGVRDADRVIAVSNRTKAMIVEKMGADPRKIRVIYNGVDEGKFQKRIRTVRNTVLFLGRLTEQKGPFQFLYAAREVLNVYTDVRFVIIGKGPLMPLLIEEAFRLGISDKVVFMGFIPETLLRKVYAMSDVYVMPSISEPFGITALEALASGTPVILSKTTGVGEALRHCFKVDFWDSKLMAEKIIALLKYAPLHREMSHNGLREAKKFSWINVAEKTTHVYKEVAKMEV